MSTSGPQGAASQLPEPGEPEQRDDTPHDAGAEPPLSPRAGTAPGVDGFIEQALAMRRIADSLGLDPATVRMLNENARMRMDLERSLPGAWALEAAQRLEDLDRYPASALGISVAVLRDLDAAMERARDHAEALVPKHLLDLHAWADDVAERQRRLMQLEWGSLAMHDVEARMTHRAAKDVEDLYASLHRTFGSRAVGLGRAFDLDPLKLDAYDSAWPPMGAVRMNWAWATTGIAARAGVAALGLNDDDDAIAAALTEAVGVTLASNAEALVGEGEAGGEEVLRRLAEAIWDRVVALAPHLSKLGRDVLVQAIAGMLVTLFVVAPNQDVIQKALEGATREMVSAARPATRSSSDRPERWQALKDRPLRANPESSGQRIATIPAGTILVVVRQLNRWLYVECVDGPAAGRAGWVYLRDMRPVPSE